MSPTVTLILYCVLVVAASLAGGIAPMLVRLTHRRMQLSLSFVAGVMLGVGLLHLLAHAIFTLGSVDVALWWTLLGFLLMFFLQRLFPFHHHEAPTDLAPGSACDHDPAEHTQHDHAHTHGHSHDHSHDHTAAPSLSSRVGWGGAAAGMALHSLIDGVALAAGVASESDSLHTSFLPGIGAFVAIVLHKPFDSLTIGALLSARDSSRRSRHVVNLLLALVVPVGVALFYGGLLSLSGDQGQILGRALAFSAGTFLCIATADLLPELQFHTHDRGMLSVALVTGVVLAWCMGLLETHGHDHLEPSAGHDHGHASAHDHDVNQDHTHDHAHDHGAVHDAPK